jgi:hypothetical protein
MAIGIPLWPTEQEARCTGSEQTEIRQLHEMQAGRVRFPVPNNDASVPSDKGGKGNDRNQMSAALHNDCAPLLHKA